MNNDKTLLTGFAIALLIYAGWRTWDYMSRYLLQDVSVTESMVIGAFFLVVTEIGYIFWLHKGQPGATTDRQETTATILVYVCLFGSLVIGFADLMVHNSLYTINISAINPILLFTPWLLIAANLIGYTIYYSGDSSRQLERADRKLKHKEVEFEINTRIRTLDELDKNQAALIEKLAPHYVKDFVDRVEGRTVKRFVRKANQIAKDEVVTNPVEEFVPEINPNGNGKEKVNPTKR